MKEKLKKILDILILLIPFIDYATNIETDFICIRFTYIIYLIYFLLNIKLLKLIYLKNIFYKIPKIYIYCIGIIIISSLINILCHNNTLTLFLKQIIIILFTFTTICMFFYNHKDNIYEILNLYMKICCIVSAIAIFQEFSYLIGFRYGYDFFWLKYTNQLGTSGKMLRVTSICGEPSMFIYAIIPAFFISLYSFLTKTKIFFKNDIYNLVIIISTLLTYSMIGYLGIITSLFLIIFWVFRMIHIKKLSFFILLFFILFSLGKSAILDRINDEILLLINNTQTETQIDTQTETQIDIQTEKQLKEQTQYNQSSYVFYVAFCISIENFKNKPIFGSGLGSYYKTYQKYVDKFHKLSEIRRLHQKDGCSLFLRITTEMGLVGLFLFFYFIFSTYIKDLSFRNKFNYWIIINNSIIVYICLRLVRNAVYYSDGIWIFILLFYFSKQKFLEEQKSESVN